MKKYIEYIKELKKKQYGSAVIFFGFYLIFFIVIAILARVGGSHPVSKSDYERSNATTINTSYLKKVNYSFTYKVELDGVTYEYVGSKKTGSFKYTYDSKEYYNDKNKSYIKEDEWKEVENPIKFNDFFDESNINEIINSSYTESKTTYDSGKTVYNLLISSNTLNKLLNDKDTDVEETPNKVTVTATKNVVNEINYNLDSYCKLNNICTNNLNVVITYSDYSNVN
jgi:hypothetical protein